MTNNDRDWVDASSLAAELAGDETYQELRRGLESEREALIARTFSALEPVMVRLRREVGLNLRAHAPEDLTRGDVTDPQKATAILLEALHEVADTAAKISLALGVSQIAPVAQRSKALEEIMSELLQVSQSAKSDDRGMCQQGLIQAIIQLANRPPATGVDLPRLEAALPTHLYSWLMEELPK